MNEYEEGHNIPEYDLVEMQNVLDAERAKVRELEEDVRHQANFKVQAYKRIDDLEAQNAVMREALEDMVAHGTFREEAHRRLNSPFLDKSLEHGRKALSITPSEAAEIVRKKEADKNQAYSERNILVCLLASMYPSGIAKTKIDGWDVEWEGCVYIDFPWGQASWHYHDSQAHLFEHLPEYRNGYDGHTTEDKYNRIIEAARAAGVEVAG